MVLGHRRRAGGPPEPVVEAADPDQEPERRRDQADRDDRGPVDERMPAVEGADGDVDAHADPEADRRPERGPVPAGRTKSGGHRHLFLPPPDWTRNWTRAPICCEVSCFPKVWGMVPRGNPGTTKAFGVTIDRRM